MRRKEISAISKAVGIAIAIVVVVAAAAAGAFFAFGPAAAPAEREPIKIGFGMALTGGLAGNGKAALIAMQMWAEDVNKRGGLLGREVELVFYDDKTDPSTVPGIYEKLLTVDNVDLVVSGYGTVLIAAAMPVIMKYGKVFPSLYGLAVNEKFNYDRYFQIMPAGSELLALMSLKAEAG